MSTDCLLWSMAEIFHRQRERKVTMKLSMLRSGFPFVALGLILLGPLASHVDAQPSELLRHTEQVTWDSGMHHGQGKIGDDGVESAGLVASDIISVSGVPWMQLKFGDSRIGNKSRIEISSLLDGSTQVLDAKSFKEWAGQSAYFNGDAVEIRFYVGPQDRRARVQVDAVVVGEWGRPAEKSICGPSDNRVDSTDSRVGRIDPIGCTGWMINNGKLLTAGHCLAGSGNTTLSINPPKSTSGGTVQFPPADRQYSIVQSSFDFVNGGVGNDWGIFAVNNNSVTGLQPMAAHGSFAFRQDLGPSTIRITGFGVDSGSDNQSNQTHTGANTGSSGTTMRYNADTQGGNSGSPVIDEATNQAVGIHTHGGCSSSGGNNSGTSFFKADLWSAVNAGGGGSGPGDPSCGAGTLDLNTLSFTSYSNQNSTNDASVEDGGDTMHLTGNTWVRSTQSFNITPNTVIDFKFASGNQGEIHAIGFDDNDTLNDNPRHFQFWGTQNWTGTGKIGLTPSYNGSGSYQSYSVPVGQSYTGNMRLVFTNDKDSGTLNNEGYFACVDIYETGGGGGGCDLEESFESGAGGWTGSGNCATGSFVVGTPDGVSNGGVQTQVSGAQDGSNALFSASNSGGAGTIDIDGGECIATSPVYNVTANSDVSAWYFHGQRDAGDDSAGDFFHLEISVNGGAWTSLQSYGDVTVNAAWTQATTTASAGDSVRLRIRAADGSSAGDLIEAGIDNISICEQ